jgi:ABC-type transporter lipoprotein component MlaA
VTGCDNLESGALIPSGPPSHRVAALGLAALLIGFLPGCSSTFERRDWSNYDGPGARYFQEEELTFPHADDPIEPVNRVTAGVNYALLRYLYAPTAAIYRGFVPPEVRDHLTKAGKNLLFPVRFLNNLLQAKWKEAAEEMTRFTVNSTVGLLGLFDPAASMGLNPHPEDFGQTFARWGWKHSAYVYLPIIGPSTVRDGLGLIPDWLSLPPVVDWKVAAGFAYNSHSDSIEPYIRTIEAYYDSYEPARTIYTITREVDVSNFTWRRDESGPTQSLESIFLKPEDPHFADMAVTREVRLDKHHELPYTCWIQREPAALFYLVPGLGGHRIGESSIALAEILYANGASVVTISNPTNWEFVAHASTVDLPGYAPVDSRNLHAAITAIDRVLTEEYPDRFTSKCLAGISMGALQTLFIAAEEPKAAEQDLLAFHVYLALDPPVDLEYAMLTLDRFYNAPLQFPAKERKRRIEEIFGKVVFLSHGDLWPGMELPFTELESQFLIGLAYRMDLQFTILQTQERHDMGVLKTPQSWLRRAPAFREASEYSYMEYMYAFVLPYFSGRDPRISFDEAGAKTLFADCDLHSIAGELAANEKVLVFANENDFVLRKEDVAWLSLLLGERAHFFPAGGHLGNLHRKAIQEVIKGTVVKKLDETAPP